MEISKLTICRQEVIVVSDTESQSEEPNKKKKPKTECVRNVKLTKITVNRIVPNCYRQRCTHAQHHHRQTSKNIKYWKRDECPVKIKEEERKSTDKNKSCERDKNDNLKLDMPGNCSPISISSSDTLEAISSNSFNIESSDSDELDDLMRITRERMKNENFPFIKASATTDDYQNISSNDDILNSSFNSMETRVICGAESIPSPRSPDDYDEMNENEHNNNNFEPICTNTTSDGKDLPQKKVPNLSNNKDNKDNMSPLYEISGKVFMEHYLNTSFI